MRKKGKAESSFQDVERWVVVWVKDGNFNGIAGSLNPDNTRSAAIKEFKDYWGCDLNYETERKAGRCKTVRLYAEM